jgi:hypothetical protein
MSSFASSPEVYGAKAKIDYFLQVLWLQVVTDSQFPRPVCILGGEGALEHLTPDEQSVRELFEYQRKLAGSRHLLERLKVLWVAAQLRERLEWCSDDKIGELLSLVQDVFGLFSPEYAVCEHAKRRLQRRNSWKW